MSKYSNEFKLQVIKYYLEEHHSYSECCKKFNIPSSTPVTKWVNRYKMYGIEGLLKQQISSYDGKFKQNVVEYMHVNHLSATETANHFRLSGADRVLKWERIYYEKGPQALYKERRGRPRKMSSKNNKKNDKKNVNENKDLLDEVQRLRMENEYLKKLNALVQERIKRENEKK